MRSAMYLSNFLFLVLLLVLFLTACPGGLAWDQTHVVRGPLAQDLVDLIEPMAEHMICPGYIEETGRDCDLRRDTNWACIVWTAEGGADFAVEVNP